MRFIRRVALWAMLAGLGAGPALQAQDQKPSDAGTPRPDHMERRFENPEQAAKSFDDPARDAWQMPDRVIQSLGLQGGQVVADIGAGTGYFTMRLAKSAEAPRVYALDIEPSMVDYVARRAAEDGMKNVRAVLTPPDRANLPEPVDLVLIVNTYHHIPGRVTYFRELRKSLKGLARVAVIDYRPGAAGNIPAEFLLTPDQISSELGQAGFRLVARYDFLPRQQFLIFQIEDGR
jgi:ubiquinone/menaquinone biosynthesis C-methylase UbiE